MNTTQRLKDGKIGSNPDWPWRGGLFFWHSEEQKKACICVKVGRRPRSGEGRRWRIFISGT